MIDLRFLSAIALCTSFASAQCAFSSVSVTAYGQGCNQAVSGQPATIATQLIVNNCWLRITVGAGPSVGNVNLEGRVLLLSLQPSVPVPLPQFGAGCLLLATPDVMLFRGPMSPLGEFTLQLPSTALPPTTVYAQGAALYRTIIPFVGWTTDWTLTAGAQIDLQ